MYCKHSPVKGCTVSTLYSKVCSLRCTTVSTVEWTAYPLLPVALPGVHIPEQPLLTGVLVRSALCTLVIHPAGGWGGEVSFWLRAEETVSGLSNQIVRTCQQPLLPVISGYRHQLLESRRFWHFGLFFGQFLPYLAV